MSSREKKKELLEFPRENLPHMKSIGKFIDSGTYGEVYCYGKDKVIKFCYPDHHPYSACRPFQQFAEFASYRKGRRLKHIAKVYRYGELDSNQYWYVCEKLSWREGKRYRDVDPEEEIELFLVKNDVPFRHDDFFRDHNIMYDSKGVAKLIDLDTFYKPKKKITKRK